MHKPIADSSGVTTATVSELRDILDRFPHESLESMQRELPLYYTQELAGIELRQRTSYAKSLAQTLGPWCRGDVLEIGPGAEDILYRMLSRHFDGQIKHWTSLDINPEVSANLKNNFRDPRYTALPAGSIVTADIGSETYDCAVGLSSLDSIISYEAAIANIFKALKKGGYLAHVQDILPTQDSVAKLLVTDHFSEDDVVLFIYTPSKNGWEYGVEAALTHVGLPDGEIVTSQEYLTRRIHDICLRAGFSSKALELAGPSPDAGYFYFVVQK